MALVLTRKINQVIVIETSDGPIRIVVLGVERDRAKLGIEAPECVNIRREELPVQSAQTASTGRQRRRQGQEAATQ